MFVSSFSIVLANDIRNKSEVITTFDLIFKHLSYDFRKKKIKNKNNDFD